MLSFHHSCCLAAVSYVLINVHYVLFLTYSSGLYHGNLLKPCFQEKETCHVIVHLIWFRGFSFLVRKNKIISSIVLYNDYYSYIGNVFGKTDYVSNQTCRLCCWVVSLALLTAFEHLHTCDTYYVSGSELETI